MEALYKNAPYYVNGPDGMIHDYEGLAAQATAPDGSVDLAKLHGEGVLLLEAPYRLGEARAAMIEGPSREALELVEVR